MVFNSNNYSAKAIAAGGNGSLLIAGDNLISYDGQIHPWGSGTYGQLGNGTTTHRSIPDSNGVKGSHSFIQAEGGLMVFVALKENGEMWSWGYNYYGSLGTGDITDHSSPVAVIGNHSFAGIYSIPALGAAGWTGMINSVTDPTIISGLTPDEIWAINSVT